MNKSGFDAKRVTPGEYWANGVSTVLISAARGAIVRGKGMGRDDAGTEIAGMIPGALGQNKAIGFDPKPFSDGYVAGNTKPARAAVQVAGLIGNAKIQFRA